MAHPSTRTLYTFVTSRLQRTQLDVGGRHVDTENLSGAMTAPRGTEPATAGGNMGEAEGRARAKYLRMGEGAAVGEGTPGNDNAPAFTVTRGELAVLVRAAVADVIVAAGLDRRAPLLLDREGLALALGCSSSLVDKLRRQGMPTVKLGDSPRFELERCLGWLRKDGAA